MLILTTLTPSKTLLLTPLLTASVNIDNTNAAANSDKSITLFNLSYIILYDMSTYVNNKISVISRVFFVRFKIHEYMKTYHTPKFSAKHEQLLALRVSGFLKKPDQISQTTCN